MSEPEEPRTTPTAITTATAPPSDAAIASRFAESIATSAKDIHAGQVVLLDRKGAVVARQRFKRSIRGWRVFIYGGIGVSLGLVVGGWVTAGVLVYLGVNAPVGYFHYRGARRLVAVTKLALDGQLDEAERRLADAPSLRWRNRAAHADATATLASHRGDHATSIRWRRQAIMAGKPGMGRELARRSLISSLALHRELAEARRERAELRLPEDLDPVLSGQMQVDLTIALCSDDPGDLPSSEALHDWASAALAYSHSGPLVAMIAWAFARHGDDEMADFLASEAPARNNYPYLATWWPELHTWLHARLARLASTTTGAEPG